VLGHYFTTQPCVREYRLARIRADSFDVLARLTYTPSASGPDPAQSRRVGRQDEERNDV
jgi:hypothetical protein